MCLEGFVLVHVKIHPYAQVVETRTNGNRFANRTARGPPAAIASGGRRRGVNAESLESGRWTVVTCCAKPVQSRAEKASPTSQSDCR